MWQHWLCKKTEYDVQKVKKYQVSKKFHLFDKQLKGYREHDDMTKAWNAVAKEIEIIENFIFFVVPEIQYNSAVEKNREVFIILTQK